jgi:hypothetical protein
MVKPLQFSGMDVKRHEATGGTIWRFLGRCLSTRTDRMISLDTVKV